MQMLWTQGSFVARQIHDRVLCNSYLTHSFNCLHQTGVKFVLRLRVFASDTKVDNRSRRNSSCAEHLLTAVTQVSKVQPFTSGTCRLYQNSPNGHEGHLHAFNLMYTSATTRTALQALHKLRRTPPTRMRNPRTVILTPSVIHQHKLSPAQPPPHSLFWQLWEGSRDIASKALDTDFVQGIAHGTLNPVVYGRYNVSDAYYCYHGAEDYAIAAARTKDVILKAYLEMKHRSYEKFNATFPETWHLKDASGIEPSTACKEYSDFERRVVREEDPVYAVVAMLPCEFLWAWLGMKLSPAQDGNLYREWIEMNNDASGAYAMGNFLTEFERSGGRIDWEKAGNIYRQAMTYEWQNFENP